jgi:protoporphyrinogen oxidase
VSEHWGVVGGGMLGMTLAMRLVQHGHRVTLLEGADQLGGLAATWRLGEVVWDKHYHVILLSDGYLRGVLAELGIDDEIEWVETRTGVYAGGELYSVSDTIEFLRFPPLRLVDKLRLGWTVFYASRIHDWRKLEHVRVEDWLVRHSGRRTFETFWKPLLRSKLGDNYRIASASFIWAIIQRLYAARRTGLKKEMFGYVRGGYARILDRFAEHLAEIGVEVRTGARVDRMRAADGGVAVDLPGESLSFDRVVATPASPLAARLIEGLHDEERSRMEGVTYQGIVCASVLMEDALADFYVTNITDTWVPFTGVIEMTSLVDRATFGGKALTYLPKYTTERDDILEWSDERVEKEFLDALERMYPAFDRSTVQTFQISRVRYVLPLATLGYSERVPRFGTSVPGVFSVNSAQILNGTLNVNETVQLAERAMGVLVGRTPDTVAALEAEVPPGGGGPGGSQ